MGSFDGGRSISYEAEEVAPKSSGFDLAQT